MVRPEPANWLDKVIAKTAPAEAPEADFAAWRQAHPEALKTLAQRAQRKSQSPTGRPGAIEFGRDIMRSPIAKLAVAAVLVAGVVVLVSHLTGHQSTHPEPKPYVAEQMPAMAPETPDNTAANELTQAKALYAQRDVTGLLSLLATGQSETKMKVAEYLGEIGGATALSALQSFAAQWQGPVDANPFQNAIDAIEERLAQPQPTQVEAVEPNTTSAERNAAPAEPNTVSIASVPLSDPITGASGMVLDKLTQAPIAGAIVGFQLSDPNTCAETDASGEFVLTGLPPSERVYICIIAQGYVSKRIVTRIARDQITAGVLIELDRSSRVEGRVTDPAGHPIADATVKTFYFTNRPVVTGADGHFEIDGLSPVVESYMLETTHPEYPAVDVRFAPGAAGQAVRQDVVLTPGVDVYGRVTDPNGQPLAGVTVGNTASRSMWNCISSQTDAEGWYRLDNVDMGELILWAVHSRYALHVQHATLPKGRSEERIDIQLQTPAPLPCRIVDEAGEPVPGVYIAVHEYNGVSSLDRTHYTSDADGWFIVPNAPSEGTISLQPFGAEIAGETQRFELGQDECIVVVRRAGRIYGRVVAEATGEPIPEFRVKLTTTSVGEQTYGYWALWNREGVTFKSREGLFDTGEDELPVGAAFRMTVFAQGYDALTLDPVAVQSISEDPNRTEFRLPAETLTAGVVVDARGNPVNGATVAVYAQSERWEPTHWRKFGTDASGVFVISGMSRDQQYLFITATGFAPHCGLRSELEAADDRPARIVLDVAARAFGVVVDEQGLPRPGLRVEVAKTRDDNDELLDQRYPVVRRSATTDKNGYYELSELPVGRCMVYLQSASGGDLGSKWATFSPGQTTEVNFGGD